MCCAGLFGIRMPVIYGEAVSLVALFSFALLAGSSRSLSRKRVLRDFW